jgi:hypothetical protein
MSGDGTGPRYSPAQLVEAVGRARGDGRYFLVGALLQVSAEERGDALAQVLNNELRPDERLSVLAGLARLRPATYLAPLIETGLRSRSINVQQTAIASLPSLVGDGLDADLGRRVERWLRHRMANPRRERTWATWEIPAAALALLPSYGMDRVVGLLAAIEPRMLPEERQKWRSLQQSVGDYPRFTQLLQDWEGENQGDADDPDPMDPTADVAVDRVMKRLGYPPINPDSAVHDPLADFDPPTHLIEYKDPS